MSTTPENPPVDRDRHGQPFTVGCTVAFIGPWPAGDPNSINRVADGMLGVIEEMIPGRAQVQLFDVEGHHHSTGGIPLSCLLVCDRRGRKLANRARDLFEVRQFHRLHDVAEASLPKSAEPSEFNFWVDGWYLHRLDRERLEELAVAVDYYLNRVGKDEF